MRKRLLNVRSVARAMGFVATASAIVATAVHLRHDDRRAGAGAASAAIPAPNDLLAPELARCHAIGMIAKDDAACEAAWAANRRRFFTYRPSPEHPSTTTAASPNGATPKSEGK